MLAPPIPTKSGLDLVKAHSKAASSVPEKVLQFLGLRDVELWGDVAKFYSASMNLPHDASSSL